MHTCGWSRIIIPSQTNVWAISFDFGISQSLPITSTFYKNLTNDLTLKREKPASKQSYGATLQEVTHRHPGRATRTKDSADKDKLGRLQISQTQSRNLKTLRSTYLKYSSWRRKKSLCFNNALPVKAGERWRHLDKIIYTSSFAKLVKLYFKKGE